MPANSIFPCAVVVYPAKQTCQHHQHVPSFMNQNYLTRSACSCLQVNPLTVIGLLEVTAVPPGSHLLVTAASSTVGRMLIQYAKTQGVKTIGTVRRQEHVEELKAMGCVVAAGRDMLLK